MILLSGFSADGMVLAYLDRSVFSYLKAIWRNIILVFFAIFFIYGSYQYCMQYHNERKVFYITLLLTSLKI